MMEQKITKKIRSVFTVKHKEYITPHLIRVVFNMDDEQSELLAGVRPGSNNKIFIPVGNDGQETIVRTYTNRKIDLEKNELSVDFVAHGDNGPASAWALKAKAGDHLGIGMKESLRPLVPESDCYLLAGDATALPVISVILEQLPAEAKAKVFLEVPTKEDELMLCSAASIETEWLYNQAPEEGSDLAKQVRAFEFPDDDLKKYVYIAAEYATVKDLRSYYRTDKGWNPREMYACSYWKAGVSEDEASEDLKN
ncbi:siderophore-interacting protein [Elizabethkingia miricola]|uniref:siderophore-interacting protein n=1 Tax=Elizabethkingia bruuniana TaxID=1756149 RepID=UPI00099B06E0|nr:siderophore-interacting protein [Elizabethkingia bruuniana]RBI91811.1 siderophore-interacting protein [Elizabethkingia miricola]